MTEENRPDNFERSDGENWDWQKETREWSGAVTELACFSLARMKGKDLIEIIDTKRGLLRFFVFLETRNND